MSRRVLENNGGIRRFDNGILYRVPKASRRLKDLDCSRAAAFIARTSAKGFETPQRSRPVGRGARIARGAPRAKGFETPQRSRQLLSVVTHAEVGVPKGFETPQRSRLDNREALEAATSSTKGFETPQRSRHDVRERVIPVGISAKGFETPQRSRPPRSDALPRPRSCAKGFETPQRSRQAIGVPRARESIPRWKQFSSGLRPSRPF